MEVRGGLRGAAWWGVLLLGALVATAAGAGGGVLLAGLLGDGFRFDWYVRDGAASIAGAEAAAWSARLAASAAILGGALALTLLYLVPWRLRPTRPIRRSRGGHALLVLGLLAAVLAAAAHVGVAGAAGSGTVSRAAYLRGFAQVGAAAAVSAFAAAWLLTWPGLARGTVARMPPGDTLVGRIMLLAARHARVVIALVVAISLVAGHGATLLRTDVDVVDVLPRGDPNTAAAQNVSERFKSTFTMQVTLHVRVNPELHAEEERRHLPYRATEPTPDNITDEVYVRAIDEMVVFLKAYVPKGYHAPPFESSIGLTSFYRLINWTYAGGRNASDASYSIPPGATPQDSGRFASVHDGVWRHIPSAPTALLSPDFRQAAILLMVDPDAPLDSTEVGRIAEEARAAYVTWAETNPAAYKVFTGDGAPKFTVDIPLANAHQTELAKRDFRLLLPVIGAFIAVCLWVQFRDLRALAVAFASLGASVLWTFGAMGYMGLPLNTVNLTVVPLIMGIGIDYAIHVLNEFQHARARGLSNEDAFRRIGRRSGLSLFIASATSIVGLGVMIVSPSLLIAQLGLLCCVALASMYLLSVTFIPAAASLLAPRRAHEYRPSRAMSKAALTIGAHRVAVVAVALLVLLAAHASSLRIEREPFGDPPRNWLPDDPLRVEHERAGQSFYLSPAPDAKANVLVFEGDVFHPDAHRYMDALEAELRKEARVMDHTLRTVPFILRTYQAIREGLPGAAQYAILNEAAAHQRFVQPPSYPTTREEIVALAREADQAPIREFAQLFYAWPDETIAVMTFTARAGTFEEAVEAWDQVWAAAERVEHLRPDGLRVSFVGNTATNYLFVQKQVPWMEAMAPVVAVAVTLLVLLMTRDLKAAFVVGVHNVATAIVWLGLLPVLGVGLSITLTLPLVFIFALGSDYALHLSLACREEDTARVFETTGKAILFSAVTTFGAFAIFSRVSNLAVQRSMIATAAAIVALFVVTTLLLPVLYRPKPRAAEEPLDEPATVA